MNEEDFILEVLKRITPDTSWYGETNHDNESLKNIYILKDMIIYLLDELLKNSYVTEGNKGNWSFERIAKAKQEALNYLYSEYFEEEE